MELLVSIGILAIVLAALAGTIVASLSSITRTEQEVIATQLVAEVSESIQVGEWDFVGLYSDEMDPSINALADAWDDRLAADGTFESAPIIEVAGPGALVRDARIPAPVVVEQREGIDFRVDRYITWVDRDGDGTVETRRLTSFASWTDLSGAARELRFDSERVPTQTEAQATDGGTRVLEHRFAPDPVQLRPDGTVIQTVTAHVRTNRDTLAGTLDLYTYDAAANAGAGGWRLRSVSMTGGQVGTAGYVTWALQLPASWVFANGQVDSLFRAKDADGNPVESFATLDTFGGPYDKVTPTPDGTDDGEGDTPTDGDPGDDPTSDPGYTHKVDINTLSTPAQLCVDASTWRLRSDATITIVTQGLSDTIGGVTVAYPYYAAQPLNSGGNPDKNAAPDAVADEVLTYVSGGQELAKYTITLEAGTRVFNPSKFTTPTFEFTAERNGGALADDVAVQSRSIQIKAGC